MTDDDLAAFLAAVAGARPLPDSGRVQLDGPPPPPRPLQHVGNERTALHAGRHSRMALQDRLEDDDKPSYLRIGLANSILRDLRLGRWCVQDEIDLHGLNRDEARLQLATFMSDSLHHGKRCLRIVHGKGLSSPHRNSILRQLVRGWVMQRDEVLAYCQARPQDGGEGAMVVLLRSPKKQRVA